MRVTPLPHDLGPLLLADGAELVVDTDGGAPLRCCLRDSHPGERLALGLVCPPGPTGPYRETGPVFVHAEPCAGPAQDWPTFWSTRDQVLRAYDHDGRITGGSLAPGPEVEARAAELLQDEEVAFVHARNVVFGCYMARLDR